MSMLSRIADSLFWIARYMERAEDTARILDVNYHMLLEQSQQTYPAALGAAGPHDRRAGASSSSSTRWPTPQTVFEFLAFDERNPNSIVQCIFQARENARTIRDRISREMWEDINSLYHSVSRFRAEEEMAVGPHRFCNTIKFGSHRFHGVSDDTLPHDEGWHFLQIGRALERADMTARIVDVEYHNLVERVTPARAAGQSPVDGGAEIRGGLRDLPAPVSFADRAGAGGGNADSASAASAVDPV